MLSDGPEIAKDRHNELAIEHREWHRDLKGMHKQRIHELELEIKKEVRLNVMSITVFRTTTDTCHDTVRLLELVKLDSN